MTGSIGRSISPSFQSGISPATPTYITTEDGRVTRPSELTPQEQIPSQDLRARSAEVVSDPQAASNLASVLLATAEPSAAGQAGALTLLWRFFMGLFGAASTHAPAPPSADAKAAQPSADVASPMLVDGFDARLGSNAIENLRPERAQLHKANPGAASHAEALTSNWQQKKDDTGLSAHVYARRLIAASVATGSCTSMDLIAKGGLIGRMVRAGVGQHAGVTIAACIKYSVNKHDGLNYKDICDAVEKLSSLPRVMTPEQTVASIIELVRLDDGSDPLGVWESALKAAMVPGGFFELDLRNPEVRGKLRNGLGVFVPPLELEKYMNRVQVMFKGE